MRVFFLLVFLLSTSAEMLDLLRNIYFAADAWTGNIQNEMDASYVEQSSPVSYTHLTLPTICSV